MIKASYNGFDVEVIGAVEMVRGGFVRQVRVIDPPSYLFVTTFSAVCDANGVLLG